jgi:tetratricopeptide (TPR) repeat protein
MLGDTCLKCNTALQKICGECGQANSVEKNYCDQCGAVLTLQPPPKEPAGQPQATPEMKEKAGSFTIEMESIQDTVSERATSFRRKPEQQPTPPPPPPPGNPKAQPPGKATSAFTPDSSRLPGQGPLPKPVKAGMAKRMAGPAVIILLSAALIGILYMIVAPSLPKLRLVMTAKSYLSSISEGKFEKAYDLLSSNSKAAISQSDYVKNSGDYYAKSPAWEFKEVQVFAMTENAAMIRYQLKEGDSDWKSDYISFVREHDRWTRPYIWILFQPIDDALRRQDFPQALFLAQKLHLTDPIDPRTSGYLCVTEFLMGLHEKAAESCKRTLDNSVSYPVGYSSSELFQFHSHYADSLRFLQRDREALLEYEKLLKWPGINADEACPLHLNRADSLVYLKEYDRALQEVMAAAGVCTKSPSKEDAQKRLRYMSGSAGPDAVTFAQKSRFQQGMPPIGEARAQQLAALKARLGSRNARFLPKDEWLAVHTAGPEYRVFLRQTALSLKNGKSETKDIHIFLINLWTGKVQIEKAAPAPGKPAR